MIAALVLSAALHVAPAQAPVVEAPSPAARLHCRVRAEVEVELRAENFAPEGRGWMHPRAGMELWVRPGGEWFLFLVEPRHDGLCLFAGGGFWRSLREGI